MQLELVFSWALAGFIDIVVEKMPRLKWEGKERERGEKKKEKKRDERYRGKKGRCFRKSQRYKV